MSIVKASSLSVDIGNARTIVVRSSAISYIPKIVLIAVLVAAVYMAAYSIGEMFGGLAINGKEPLWGKVLWIVFTLFIFIFSVVIAYSSMRIIASDNVDSDVIVPIKWAMGIAAAFLVLNAGFEISGYITIQETGGNFGDNYKAKEETMSRSMHEAGAYVLMSVGLLLAYLSLRLVDRKDVHIVRDDGVQKLKNVSGRDALILKDSLQFPSL